MIYEQLYRRAGRSQPVRAGLIGSGKFGKAIVSQAQSIPLLKIVAIADLTGALPGKRITLPASQTTASATAIAVPRQ